MTLRSSCCRSSGSPTRRGRLPARSAARVTSSWLSQHTPNASQNLTLVERRTNGRGPGTRRRPRAAAPGPPPPTRRAARRRARSRAGNRRRSRRVTTSVRPIAATPRRTVSRTASTSSSDSLPEVRVGDDPRCRGGDERRGQGGERSSSRRWAPSCAALSPVSKTGEFVATGPWRSRRAAPRAARTCSGSDTGITTATDTVMSAPKRAR